MGNLSNPCAARKTIRISRPTIRATPVACPVDATMRRASLWRKSLTREISYLGGGAERLPLLGSPGHTVDELLAANRRQKKPRLRAGFSSQRHP